MLTKNILRSELSQVLELEVNVNNGDAACDGQDDDITAQNLL